MKTITDREAADWLSRMKPDAVVLMLREHHALKQGLCANTLGVPTGTDDWVDRSIAAAYQAMRCQWELRKLISSVESTCAEARNNVRETVCINCRGRGLVGESSCAICYGTGLRPL